MNLKINNESFLYDAYGLVQAFYPGEKPKVYLNKEIEEENKDTTIELLVESDSIEMNVDGEKKGEISIDESNRPDTKNRLKRLIYQVLEQKTKHTLPWGTLTGIRPTKIPLKKLKNKESEEEVRLFMKETYLCSDEKISLATEIAKRELSVVGEMGNKYALYIGIPFCPSICLYCSFSSYPLGLYKDKTDAYLDALIKEIAFCGGHFKDRVLDTIYMGGGTPSSLSASQFERLLSAVEEHLDLSHLREFTVEAGRPDSITRDKLEVLANHNIDRISINPQTMHQKTLDLIGRFHSVEQIREAYAMAREVSLEAKTRGKKGFLINMDLIVGLPGESKEDVAYTLSEIKKMAPDNLTVHSLAIKRSSRLNIQWEDYENEVFENSDDIMVMVHKCAKELGMSPYYMYRQKQISGNLENIGFSPEGKECLYNIEIMEELCDIVALGAGSACKKVGRDNKGGVDLKTKVERCENVKDVDLYMERIDEMIERKRQLYQL
ncbi:MAG: coproporphyrinogen dehydrogenase HemZ [Lachnospiraceae bacterium]|nr:coproporphyrinogen dehydrogenase HemZ [Lachnospiraceae bacterium]